MRRELLTTEEIDALASVLPLWTAADGALTRTFEFADFTEAFAFMTRVAFVAEALDHHPDWSNVYNRVTIAVSTHDRDGLTDFDVAFAQQVDALTG